MKSHDHEFECESEYPAMGVSKWKLHGQKYGYWQYFEDQIKNDLLAIADTGEYEDMRREIENYFNKKST